MPVRATARIASLESTDRDENRTDPIREGRELTLRDSWTALRLLRAAGVLFGNRRILKIPHSDPAEMLTAPHTTRYSGRRAAFTLLELVLVLSVLGVIIGISWPSVVQYMADEAIRESAQSVQAEAAGTRIKAIDTGLTYQFRYEPNGRRFAVIPFDPPQNIDSTATPSPTNPGHGEFPVQSGQIAETCRFLAPDDGLFRSAAVERLPREMFANLPDAFDLAATAWAPPVLFFSDGTATDATFRIVDEGKRSIGVSVRGLTGTVSTEPLERESSP